VKHVQQFIEINRTRKRCIFRDILAMNGYTNVKIARFLYSSFQEVTTSPAAFITIPTVQFKAECTCGYCSPVEYITLFRV